MLTTETKVTLDLSPISLLGESPVARFGFFRGLKCKDVIKTTWK